MLYFLLNTNCKIGFKMLKNTSDHLISLSGILAQLITVELMVFFLMLHITLICFKILI